MPLGLYLHIPFCASICSYCNFNRGLLDAELKRLLVDALEVEIRRAERFSCDPEGTPVWLHAEAREPADTIYFGGGTPSLLEPREVSRLIGACRDTFDVHPSAEVTLEANPETVTAASLTGFREAGVNRLSFGVQSFRDEELRRLGRAHDADRARAAFREARSAGFDNVSLDLMLWLPGQTIEHARESVEELSRLRPEHASIYLLELYPNSPLRESMARADWSQSPEDEAADMYLMTMERLEEEGYEQYEISNVARRGRRSRHNMKYWDGGDWHGFGPGAHSTRGGARWNNVAGTAEYMARVQEGAPAAQTVRRLDGRERLEEALFMGLRLAEGISLPLVSERFGVDAWATWGDKLAPAVEAGLLVYADGRLRLTRQGMLVANDVMATFLEADCTVK